VNPARPSWREFDAATREREYSPSSCIGGNYQPFIAAYAQRSAAARDPRSGLKGRLDLAYGESAAQRLDLFVPDVGVDGDGDAAAGVKPPLLVFIHGGYWQELSKDESSFAAADALRQGLAFAALDYTLAPAASVAEMVRECRRALAWLQAHAVELGFDGSRIVVAGSSAGAHLAAMCALPAGGVPAEKAGEGAVRATVKAAVRATAKSAVKATVKSAVKSAVRAVVLVSGIYEVEPLVGTSINAALGLDAPAAREVSPALADLRGFPPAVVCWGAVETGEFKRQGRDFAAALQRAGTPCRAFEVPERNHFDVILDLADPATPLGQATLALVRSA
jgi:arylformamidase